MRKKKCDVRDKWNVPLCKREFWTRRTGAAFCWVHRRKVVKVEAERES